VNALIYAHVSDEGAIGTSGLYSASGAKMIAEIFKSVDDKNVGDASYISNLIGKEWKELYSNGSKNAVRRERFDGEAPMVQQVSGPVDTDFFAGKNDVYLVDKQFTWTYVHTHEADCGPYFRKV
jgi:hypothetical protein